MKENVPSRTALVIAMALIILGGDEYGRRHCPSASSSTELQFRVLQKSGVLPKFLSFRVISNVVLSKLVRWNLRILTAQTGVLEGIGIRKLYMEEQVRTRIAAHHGGGGGSTNSSSCRQVLILAAGYDTLALRLSKKYSNVQFWEVDHPATAQRKQQALQALGQPDNLHTIAADLACTTLAERLSMHKEYDTNAPTVVIMEGLLMYLTDDQVRSLFDDVSRVVGSEGSAVCFDYFRWNRETNLADVGWLASAMQWRLKRVGEPWKWGIDPSELSEFFAKSAWHVTDNNMTRKVGLEHLATVERN